MRSVGILGATGEVGQKFILSLQDHPWFRVEELYASSRSAGENLRGGPPVREGGLQVVLLAGA